MDKKVVATLRSVVSIYDFVTRRAQETTLARHLAKSVCAYKILQDGRFGKIEQEDLSITCKINQEACLAR